MILNLGALDGAARCSQLQVAALLERSPGFCGRAPGPARGGATLDEDEQDAHGGAGTMALKESSGGREITACVGFALILVGAALVGYEFGIPHGPSFKGIVCSFATFANGMCMLGVIAATSPKPLTPAEQAEQASIRG